MALPNDELLSLLLPPTVYAMTYG